MGFPDGASGKEPTCQCRRCERCRFCPWVGKIPWWRIWQPTPVFLPGESMLKEIDLEYSLERLMLRPKLQYFDHLMQRADSLEKILMLGKIEGRTSSRRQRMRWLDGIINSMDMNLSKLQEIVKKRGA